MDLLEKYLGPNHYDGPMGFARYRYYNKKNVVLRTAKVLDGTTLLWEGFLDLTLHLEELVDVSEKLGRPITVSQPHGMDVVTISKGNVSINPLYANDIEFKNTTLILKKFKLAKITPKKYNKEDFIEVPLIPVKKIPIRKNGEMPYVTMYTALAASLGIPVKDIEVGKVYLIEKDADYLIRLTKKWAKKERPYWDAYTINKDISFLTLEIGPNTFQGKPRWARAWHAYVLKEEKQAEQ